MFAHHMWAYPQKSEEDTGSPELEFWMVVNYQVAAGNRTWVLRKAQVLLTAAPPFQLHDG